MNSLLKGVIRNGRVEVDKPIDLPEGTEVFFAPNVNDVDDALASSEEIAKVLAAMNSLLPLDIPDTVSADLDDWERKLNRQGIDHVDPSAEDTFR